MDPVHCSSVHFRVEILNDQVSLKSCGSPRPLNLQNIIREEGRDKTGYEHNDTVTGGY